MTFFAIFRNLFAIAGWTRSPLVNAMGWPNILKRENSKQQEILLSWCFISGFHILKDFSPFLVQKGCYIEDCGLAAVGECCKFLEDLNFRFCEALSDRGVVQLALGCGNTLKSLGVAACDNITDVSYEAVGSHCRSLESLKWTLNLSIIRACLQLLKDVQYWKFWNYNAWDYRWVFASSYWFLLIVGVISSVQVSKVYRQVIFVSLDSTWS